MSMGSMGMLPELTEWPDFYYAVIGAAVGVATIFNVYNYDKRRFADTRKAEVMVRSWKRDTLRINARSV